MEQEVSRPGAQGEVIRLRDGFHVAWKGVVSSATWRDKGPAEAQLDLLRSGYSAMTMEGRIKHLGTVPPLKTLHDVAVEALNLMGLYEEVATADRAFDGGEWSGPASARAMHEEITRLAEANGFTYREVEAEVNIIAYALPSENEVRRGKA